MTWPSQGCALGFNLSVLRTENRALARSIRFHPNRVRGYSPGYTIPRPSQGCALGFNLSVLRTENGALAGSIRFHPNGVRGYSPGFTWTRTRTRDARRATRRAPRTAAPFTNVSRVTDAAKPRPKRCPPSGRRFHRKTHFPACVRQRCDSQCSSRSAHGAGKSPRSNTSAKRKRVNSQRAGHNEKRRRPGRLDPGVRWKT